MICSDIWHITSGIYAKYHVQIMLLFFYTTIRKRFVIFTSRYFKLSWNTTAISHSNCGDFQEVVEMEENAQFYFDECQLLFEEYPQETIIH